jgi:hypothetical protein
MAKRARGAVRPGQRRPGSRPQQRPSAPFAGRAEPVRDVTRDSAAEVPARTGGLTADEERRAAELEERILEEERAAEQNRRRRDSRGRGAEIALGRTGTAQAGTIATRASEEYAYVVRDVRRIVTIGGALLVILFALFFLIEVGHVVTI